MIRLCAWCNCVLGRTSPVEDGKVSHGICLACQQALLEEEPAEPGAGAPNPVMSFILVLRRRGVYFPST